MELAPSYDPLRDDIIRLHFVNAKRRRQKIEQGDTSPGMPLLSDSPALVKLTRDWKTLSQLLLVKGKAWEYEKEVRLTVGLQHTRDVDRRDDAGWPVGVLDVPPEEVRDVYVGFNTPLDAIEARWLPLAAHVLARLPNAGDKHWTTLEESPMAVANPTERTKPTQPSNRPVG